MKKFLVLSLSIILLSACGVVMQDNSEEKSVVDEFLINLEEGDFEKAKDYLADEIQIEIDDYIEKTTINKEDVLKIDLLGDFSDQFISVALKRFFKSHEILGSSNNLIRANVKTIDYEKIIDRLETVDSQKILTKNLPGLIGSIFTSGIEGTVDKLIDIFAQEIGGDFKDLFLEKNRIDNEVIFILEEVDDHYLIKSVKK